MNMQNYKNIFWIISKFLHTQSTKSFISVTQLGLIYGKMKKKIWGTFVPHFGRLSVNQVCFDLINLILSESFNNRNK